MFLLPNNIFYIVLSLVVILNIAIIAHLIFCTSLSFFGLQKPKREYEIINPKRSFLFIVPAHNEENVIEATIQGLLNLNYDKKKYDIVIIADNCSDNTVEIVKKYPEVHLLENFSAPEEPRGKPHAIAKLFMTTIWQSYDFISFIDADNIVDSHYLTEMNSQLEKHPEFVAIQGYLGIKNVSSSFTATGYAAAYFIANRMTQLANYRLGWNAAIGGTGFILSVDYLKKNGWNPKSYTEDFELQVELSIQGLKTGWNHFAVVYDEKPNSLKASHRQRTRWAQGHWKIALTTTKQQLLSLIKCRSFVNAMNLLNTLFYSYSMIRPPIIVGILGLAYIIDYRFFICIPFLFSVIPCWIILEIWNYLIIPLICFPQEGKNYFSSKNKMAKLQFFFRLSIANIYNSVVYMFAQLVGFFTWFKPQNNWQKTVHFSEMEEVKK